ncbi:MAG: histidine ammonia-lyase [Rhodospirillaceae bacterium]|nr:histidine ammonia-lyase [Rhodospirillaceae bacterium]
MPARITLSPGALTLADLRALEDPACTVAIADEGRTRMQRGSKILGEKLAAGKLVYSVNTGFGPLSGTRIADDKLGELQLRLILSNSTGVGKPLAEKIVRRIMVLKLAALLPGTTGVRVELAEAILALLNAGIHPVIPEKGSVGASGDLAPLAHLGAGLIGIGEVFHKGTRKPAVEALKAAGLAPFVLGPKEGAAIVNGTQVSTALAVEGLFRTEECFAAALVAGAMSVEASRGSAGALDARIHEWRGQPGQQAVAAALRGLLDGSAIQAAGSPRIQDPYCLRCQPQVMGAALDLIRNTAETLRHELNAVSDNPLICLETGDVLFGGNFHAQPIGLAADSLALAIAETGSISERRIAFLVDAHMSGLPAFLVEEGGLNSGFMLAQVTAAALVSENKAMAHPGSIDSIPTGANYEDYVSMATYAARRTGDMAENLRHIIAIELLAGCQGLEFRRPTRSSDILESVFGTVRKQVAKWDQDRFFKPDLDAAASLIGTASLIPDPARAVLPSMNGNAG